MTDADKLLTLRCTAGEAAELLALVDAALRAAGCQAAKAAAVWLQKIEAAQQAARNENNKSM